MTPFDWDRLVLVPPYAHTAGIQRILGFPWPDAHRVDMSQEEGWCLLVFVQDDQVVRYIKMARQPVDFAPRQSGHTSYTPPEAVFRTVKRNDWVYAAPVSVADSNHQPPADGTLPMGVITDFFAATPAEFSRVLRGWKLPPPLLPEPVEVDGINPFTKQPITLRTRVNRDAMPEPDPTAIPSPDISSLPVVRARALLPDRLALVLSTLTHTPPDDALDQVVGGIVVGPPQASITVTRLPDVLHAALAAADANVLRPAAQALADEDAETLGSAPRGAADGYAALLSQIAHLARTAKKNRASLFVWMAP